MVGSIFSKHRILSICSVVLASIVGIILSIWLYSRLPLALPLGGAVLEVGSGDSLRKVLNQVKNRGWLQYPRLVEWWARYQGLDQGLHIGEYRVEPGASAADLVRLLNRGDVIPYRVTLPEGITLFMALERLKREPMLIHSLSGVEDPMLKALLVETDEYGNNGSVEGWFLPETYQFTRGDSDLDILKRAHAAMIQTLKRAWAHRADNTPLTTPYEALVLASIVERETSVAEERPAIAGVFSRRLQRGMRLQTDPTVIYGLGEKYRGNLKHKHLRDSSNPWNTYVIKGLPPTPIALPGVAAIEAAVSPVVGKNLYFVARGDGYHAFAATLEEHHANIKRYQLLRRTDYRSTPHVLPMSTTSESVESFSETR